MTYLRTAEEFYREAATTPQPGLCCTTSPVWKLPDLDVPEKMLEMNYGCGSTVHPRDLGGSPTVLYVGVGGGMELLQFAYFSRRPGAVIGVDPVGEMREAARLNLAAAAASNAWFNPLFVDLRAGDALDLNVPANSVDVAAQNCLFNVFEADDLKKALAGMHRVLRPGGRLVMSDPVAPRELPAHLVVDERLRAMCLSGAITLDNYIGAIVEAGFGTVEVRARRPYRVLDPGRYDVDHPILLESLEVAAVKGPLPADGPCVFTGRTAIYFGPDENWADRRGHLLVRDRPLSVCDKTATNLERLNNPHILVTASNWFYDGGGCC